jgi:MFS family permease
MEDAGYPKYRWFILVSLCIVQATAVMALVSPVTIIGEISRTIGVDMGMTTQIIMVAVNIFVGISAFFGGGIIDRLGAYKVWAGCSVLFIAGTLFIPVIGHTVPGILAVRLIQGFGAGPIMATAPLVAAQWFPPKERGIVIGFQGALVSIGAITSMTFVPFVFQKTGNWQTALAWLNIFFVITLILSIIVAVGPEPPVKEVMRHPELSEFDIKKAYKLPATWAALSASLWFNWVVGIFRDVLTNYLSVDPPVGVGLGPLKAGSAMSGVNLAFFIAAVSSGVILEKVFRGKARFPVMLGFIIPAFLWFSIRFSFIYSNTITLIVCMVVGAFGVALTSPLILTFFAKNYPEGIMGKLGGQITTINIAGTLIGEGVGSYALSVTGCYDIAINLVGAGAFMGFLSAFFLKEPKGFPK